MNFNRFFTEERKWSLPDEGPYYIYKDELTGYKLSEKEEEGALGALYPNVKSSSKNIWAAIAIKVYDYNVSQNLKIDFFHLAKSKHDEKIKVDLRLERFRNSIYLSSIDKTVDLVNKRLEEHPNASLFFVASHSSKFNEEVKKRIEKPSETVGKRTLGDLLDSYNKDPLILNDLVKFAKTDRAIDKRAHLVKLTYKSFLENSVAKDEKLKKEPLSTEKISEHLTKEFKALLDRNIIDKSKYLDSDLKALQLKQQVLSLLKPTEFFVIPETSNDTAIVVDDNVNSQGTYEEVNDKLRKKHPGLKTILWVVGVIPTELISLDIKKTSMSKGLDIKREYYTKDELLKFNNELKEYIRAENRKITPKPLSKESNNILKNTKKQFQLSSLEDIRDKIDREARDNYIKK